MKSNYFIYLIIIFAAILFIPFLGAVHLFDWDEINFAESAREMIVSSDYLNVRINFLPFWEKPPLFIWMQVISMKIFGINEFAARFPNALCGILTLYIIYRIGKKYNNHNFGIIWVFCYLGSFLPFIYFKSGIIDPWFNLFIFSSIYFFVCFLEKRNILHLTFSSSLMGLAILTKGPVAFLILILVFLVYLIVHRFKIRFTFKEISIFAVILIFTGGLWFILQILNGNYTIIQDFIIYQIRLFKTKDAGHGGFLFYHFFVLLIGVFPASIFALKNIFSFNKNNLFHFWMVVLFWVVLILFTIVRTKIVHYSSLCYFPLTYLAAYSLNEIIEGKKQFPVWMKIAVGITGSLYVILVIVIPILTRHKNLLIPYIHDDFAIGNLSASVNWSGFESITSVILIAGLFAFFIFQKKNETLKSLTCLFASTILFISLVLIFFVPKIEKYSQNAAVEFFRNISHEDAYVSTIGYKSYAHLFYGNISIPLNKKIVENDWLLKGDVDKKVYFASKINSKQEVLEKYKDIHLLYEKNGFVFWLRNKK